MNHLAGDTGDAASVPSGRPLVTFVVLSYNQEAFIEEAVQSALRQTYSPLQIIISDDASIDRSSDIVESVIKSYSGPHAVSTHRNAKNLGIGAHVNEVFRKARGELVILAGGDDISRPERTTKVVDAWLNSDRQCSAIFCGANRIDRHGRYLGIARSELESGNYAPSHLMTFRHPSRYLVIGACGAYGRDVMRHFGDLDPDLPIEDIPLLIRASMLGGVRYIPERLVDYRTSVSVWRERKPENDNFALRIARRRFYTGARHAVAKQVLKDAISSNNNEFIIPATKGYMLHSFVDECCRSQSMNWRLWLAIALATQNWRYSLLAAVMDGHPTAHRLLFSCKQAMNASISRFCRLLRALK